MAAPQVRRIGKWHGDVVLLDALQLAGFTKGEAFRAAARDPDEMKGRPGWIHVLQDPYEMTRLEGIGFDKADKFALEVLGVPKDHPSRIRACAVYVLEQAAYNGIKDDHRGMGGGHTWLPRGIWGREVLRLTEAEPDACRDAIGNAVWRGMVGGCVAAARPSRLDAEGKTAMRLGCSDPVQDAGDPIVFQEASGGVTLGDDQASAVRTSTSAGVSVITGRAGTGKTTALRAVMRDLYDRGEEPELCAPTGKAARRAAQATGTEAKTIHRLLGYNGVGFGRREVCNAVVVDEASMVDASLLHALTSRMTDDARLVLCGDPYQLPPVGPGAPLRDVIDARIAPAVELLKVRRSAGVIPRMASRLIDGDLETSTVRDHQSEWVVDACDDDEIHERALAVFEGWEKEDPAGVEAGLYAVICYRNKDVDAINQEVQARRTGEAAWGVFNEGDRVIWTKANNYPRDGVGPEVLNGQVGIVTGGGTMRDAVVLWDGAEAEMPVTGLRGRLCLAYALTCHRAQGSEYRDVLVAVSNADAWLLDRTWIYTAVTRAKRSMRLVGSLKAARSGTRRRRAQARRTLLAHFHRGEVAGWTVDDGTEIWDRNAAGAAGGADR
jgi:exodeoxyribonuclease V alpha subunit